MEKNVAIISTENFRRNELHFKVLNKKKNESLEKTIELGYIKLALVKAISDLAELDKCDQHEVLEKKEGIYENTGIIFNPYAKRGGKRRDDVIMQEDVTQLLE